MTTTAGDLTIQVANTKTLDTTVDVNENTLTLSEAGGAVTAVNLDTNNGVLDINEDCTVTTCDFTANGTLSVANTKTLTATNGVDTNTATVTLNETGTVSRVDVDGAGGELEIDADGTVTAFDPEGVGASLGTIELYSFPNPAGLFSRGHNLYRSTDASGEAVNGTPGSEGMGTIVQGFVEISNVEVAKQANITVNSTGV